MEMSENWINVEDDSDIIDAKIDELIDILEDANFISNEIVNSLINDYDDPEDIFPINQNIPVP